MLQGTSIWEEFKLKILNSGNVLYHLIFANVAVFLLLGIVEVVLKWFTLNASLFNTIHGYLAVPSDPVELLTKPWTLITYMFMHAGFFHILFNMLILYWFGRIFQQFLDDKKLLSTFLIGGIAGAFIFILAYQFLPALAARGDVGGMVGASAGVMAVVIATATLVPDFTLNLLFIGPVRLKYIALFMVVISFLGTAGSNAGGEFSHLGGALYGFVYIRKLQQGQDIGQWMTNITGALKNAFFASKESKFKVHKNEQARNKSSKKGKSTDQKEIDRILDKIAESGYESLTQEEKDTLFKASK